MDMKHMKMNGITRVSIIEFCVEEPIVSIYCASSFDLAIYGTGNPSTPYPFSILLLSLAAKKYVLLSTRTDIVS